METKDLNKFITKAKKVKAKNNTLAILDYILVNDQHLTVSDLDHFYSMKFDCLDTNTKVLIPFGYLEKIVKKVKKGNIDLNEPFIIKTEKGNFTYDQLDVDEFPEIPDGKLKDLGILNSDCIKLIKEATKFIANDELRPVMNAVLVDKKNIVCSDTHKLIYKKHSDAVKESFLLTKKTCITLENQPTTVFYIEPKPKESIKYLLITSDNEVIIQRIVVGQYPKWKSVIPSEYSTTLKIDNKTFLEFIEVASISCNQTSELIALSVLENNVKVSSKDIDFATSYEGSVPFKSINGEEIIIGFKASFMKQCLNALPDNVTFKFIDNTKAIIMNDCCLLMPMMLRE